MGSRLAHLRCLQITQPTTNVELGFNPLCKNLKCPNMFSSISIKAINCLLLSFMRNKILNKLYGLSIRFQHIDTKFGLRRISCLRLSYLPLIGCLHLIINVSSQSAEMHFQPNRSIDPLDTDKFERVEIMMSGLTKDNCSKISLFCIL